MLPTAAISGRAGSKQVLVVLFFGILFLFNVFSSKHKKTVTVRTKSALFKLINFVLRALLWETPSESN